MEGAPVGEWRRDSEEDDGGRGLRFHFAAVNHLKLRIDEHNAAWRSFFERCGIEPLRIVYEDFVEAYGENLLGLLSDLGIAIPESFAVAESKMKRQADELSEEWVRMYHEAAEADNRTRKG